MSRDEHRPGADVVTTRAQASASVSAMFSPEHVARVRENLLAEWRLYPSVEDALMHARAH